jgi:hypothetical protein
MTAVAQMLVVGRWALQVAPNWSSELDDGCVCITKADGAGVLLISHADKRRTPVTREELQRLAAAELPPSADSGECCMGDFEGLHATYVADDARWHRFYLSYGSLLLLVTYTIQLEHDGVEDEEVIATLRSLRAQGNPWE